MATRRSIRRFKAKPVERDDLHFIIEMAMKAPSAGNLQDYRFIIVRDKAVIKELPDYCMDQMWISGAPIVIVVCSQPKLQKKWYGAPGEIFARQNAAAATQNILLAAHGLGLGACWVSGFNQEKVDNLFELNGKARVESIIPIGYPAEKPVSKTEFTLNNMLFFDIYEGDIADWDRFTKNYSGIIEKKLASAKEKFKEKSSGAKVTIKDISKKLKDAHAKVKKKLKEKK